MDIKSFVYLKPTGDYNALRRKPLGQAQPCSSKSGPRPAMVVLGVCQASGPGRRTPGAARRGRWGMLSSTVPPWPGLHLQLGLPPLCLCLLGSHSVSLSTVPAGAFHLKQIPHGACQECRLPSQAQRRGVQESAFEVSRAGHCEAGTYGPPTEDTCPLAGPPAPPGPLPGSSCPASGPADSQDVPV